MTSPILMNDFRRQWRETGDKVLAAVGAVGESGWYILGKEVDLFEKALAGYIRRRAVVGCASGLDAIEMGLRALGLQPGQKVLTTPLSAFATTLGIVRAGGVPVFVDVDESGLLDLELTRHYLERDPAIRVLLPVHLFGHALDLQQLEELKEHFELSVLEDCCQAIGARFSGRDVGSVGQAGALSFYPTKNLGALGDGGALITDDVSIEAACRSLRDYGQTAKYVHEHLGLNSRLDELHAAVLGRAFLPKLEVWSARRRAIAKLYLAGIRSPLVRPVPVASKVDSAWHLFPVTVAAEARDAFLLHLSERQIQYAIHYPRLIPNQGALRGVPFSVLGDLTRAQRFALEEVSLPIHPSLGDEEVARVVDAINEFRAS